MGSTVYEYYFDTQIDGAPSIPEVARRLLLWCMFVQVRRTEHMEEAMKTAYNTAYTLCMYTRKNRAKNYCWLSAKRPVQPPIKTLVGVGHGFLELACTIPLANN